MIHVLTYIKRTAVVMVCFLLSAQLAPSLALACEGGAAECSGTEPAHKCIWQIKETEAGSFEQLKSNEEANIESESGSATITLTAGTSHEIKCEAVTVHGELIGGEPGTGEISNLELTKCSTPNEAGCKVKSSGDFKAGTITFVALPITMAERETEKAKHILSAVFEPRNDGGTKELTALEFGTTEKVEGEKTFEHIVLTGSCTKYPASTTLTGTVASEVAANEFNFPSTVLKGNTLEAFGESAKLVGKLALRLEEPGEFKGA